jgi:hypothetical protein
VERLPGPGEAVLSPALAELLASPEGALLRPRFPQRVIGIIGPDGLGGPRELFFYVGTDDLADRASPDSSTVAAANLDMVVTVYDFGSRGSAPARPIPPLLLLLTTLGVASLLVPVVVFLATSTRLAAEARGRRLAAVRLVGASADQARRIAASEAVVGAATGVVVGVVLFLVGRQLASTLLGPALGGGFYASDIRPAVPLAIAVVVGVPLLAVAVSLVSFRRVIIEPLSVVRRSRVVRRRLAWRLVPVVSGAALLYLHDDEATTIQHSDTVGLALLLLGVPLLLPWVVERGVHLLPGGPPAWRLAVRRLQLDSTSSTRIIGGLATALAGGIALQTLFVTAESEFVVENPEYARTITASVTTERLDLDRLLATIRRIPGATVTGSHALTFAASSGQERMEDLFVADCDELRRLATLPRCRPGDVFRAVEAADVESADDTAGVLEPGEGVWLTFGATPVRDGEPEWTVPARLPTVTLRPDLPPHGPRPIGILATPEAVRDVAGPYELVVHVLPPPGDRTVVEHVRNALVAFGWTAHADQLSEYTVNETYAPIRTALLLGCLVTLALCALSMLVIALEQLRERKRPLAILAALGVPRSVMARSMVWQAAIPLAFALVVAALTGLGLGGALLWLVEHPAALDRSWTITLCAAATAAVLAVTVLTLPALWRMTEVEGLRTE